MLRIEVVLRNCEDIAKLQSEIDELQHTIKEKDQQIYRMGLMVGQSLGFIDMLKIAKQMLDEHGLDSSFIQFR